MRRYKWCFIRWFLILILIFQFCRNIIAQNVPTKLAILIEIKGSIRPDTQDFFARGLKKAQEE